MNLLFLPATTPGGGQLSDIFLPLFLLLLAVIIGATLVHFLRRAVRRTEDQPDEGFTLHDLRTMHKSGALSDEEFQRAKTRLLEQVARGAEGEPEGPKKPQSDQLD